MFESGTMWRLLSQIRRDEKGTSLIEFSLVAPVVLMMGLGLVEFGNAFHGRHIILTGVRDAARYVARFNVPADHYSAARTLAVTGSTTGTVQRLSWWGAGDVTLATFTIANPIDGATGERTYRGPDPITLARVSTSASYTGFGFLHFLGLGSSLTVTVTHEERVIHE